MYQYDVWDDIEVIRELLNLSIEEFAEKIGVAASTIHRWKTNEDKITPKNLAAIYEFAFKSKIHLNIIKAQLFKDTCPDNHIVLFHGSKNGIDGKLSLENSKKANDFGKGFYCGESLEQSAMFVANYPNSSLYIIDFDQTDLKYINLSVERDWMLMIAYFRGKLDEYVGHPIIQDILSRLGGIDYIVAPIADNRMFEIIDSFIAGEITDVQCRYCLSATDLGKQYVFLTEKALDHISIIRKCYLAPSEKKMYLQTKADELHDSNNKSKIARKQYRNQGLYIEEILQ